MECGRGSYTFTMLPLLLLSNLAVSIAAPRDQCDIRKVAITGGSYAIGYADNDNMVVAYYCPKGKYPHPVAYRECQGNGKWTSEGQKFTCREVECPRLMAFEGGEYFPRKAKYRVGDVLHFDCWGGFRMVGAEQRTCQENGKWSGVTTICDDDEGFCSNPGIPIGAVKKGSVYRIESKVRYECLSGLKMLGSEERECREDKTWSGTEPSCRQPYTYDSPKEVAEEFASTLAETVEASDLDRQTGKTDRKMAITSGGLMNIFILLDASNSMGFHNFSWSKNVTELFIDKLSSFDFTPRYSVSTFASHTKEVVKIMDEESTDPDEVIKKIRDLKFTDHADGQGTNTRQALYKVYEQLSLFQLKRRDDFLNTSNIILLITDGNHNMGGDPSLEVKKIREFLNIRKDNDRERFLDIYVFGLGDISHEEINAIASKKDKETHSFTMESMEKLHKAFELMIDDTNVFEMCGLSKDYSTNSREKFPWVVKVKRTSSTSKSELHCKGTIISQNYILTAAHCFRLDDPVKSITVEFGEGVTRKAKDLHRHGNFSLGGKRDKSITQSFDFDFALVELEKKIEFSSKIRPICLPCTGGAALALKLRDKNASCRDHETMLLSGEEVQAMFLTQESKDDDNLVRKVVHIRQGNRRERCLEDAKKVKIFENVTDIKDAVTDNFLCTGGINPLDPQTCKGDSGGPLIIQHKHRFFQVGVISWGTVESCKDYTRSPVPPQFSRDFHASIMSVTAWINSTVKDDLNYLQ